MSEILVEVVPKPGETVPLSGTAAERFEARAAEIAEALGRIAGVFRSEFDRQAGADDDAPGWVMHEVTLDLSINLEAQAGVIIARAKTGAAFQASLKWRRG